MAQLEMYPPIINSPTTQLANAIDSTTTSIEVVDGARLPDAPNICTIGRGENPETILYTSKVGNVISGITRGFQGNAQNWQAGTQVARLFTAYDLESIQQNHKTHLAEKVHIGNNPYVSVRHNLDQSIPHNTATILEFNTLNFDNDEMYNAAEPTKITIKTPGRYLIEYKGEWSANATGIRQAEIYWNRAGILGRKRINATTNGGTTASVMTVVSLYENDYIEIRVFQNSGSALNIINAPTISSYLTVVKVG